MHRPTSFEGFTDEERAAMKERPQELKAEARAKKDKAAGEVALLAAIAAMKEPDRSMGRRLHEIIKCSAPMLWPKTWYGMPAYLYICKGRRQSCLLLPKRAEVQDEIRDVGLHRRGEPG